jgi:hypothetical protein
MFGSLCLRGLPAALPSLFIGIALFAVAPGDLGFDRWDLSQQRRFQ